MFHPNQLQRDWSKTCPGVSKFNSFFGRRSVIDNFRGRGHQHFEDLLWQRHSSDFQFPIQITLQHKHEKQKNKG